MTAKPLVAGDHMIDFFFFLFFSFLQIIYSEIIFRSGKFILVPLHSTLTSEEQAAVFHKPKNGVRKIVLSTNIAETSVTIDDCVFVVDCGKMKEKR